MSKKQNMRIDPRQRRFLGLADQLEENAPPRLASLAIGLTATALAAGMFWTATTNVDETSLAEGKVEPSGNVRLIQHLEGGIVSEIMTEAGALVKAGDPLIRLSEGSAVAELEKARAREAGLALQAERLRAFAGERNPEFEAAGRNFPQLIEDQQAIWKLQEENRTNQARILEEQIAERSIDYQTLVEQTEYLKEQIRLSEEATAIRGQLYEKGLATKPAWLDAQRDLTQSRSNLVQASGQVMQAKERVDEARQRLHELKSRLANEALTEMGRVTAELAQLRETIRLYEDKADRLVVRAPVTGVVNELTIAGLGEVIGPGGKVAEIVPIDDKLVVAARLNPQDIGNVELGSPVLVKVSAYDFARFGGLEGTLDHISPTTFEDPQNGETYYEATISLSQPYVGANPEQNLLLPGMVVQANINTGSRTVLEYLTKPVRNAMADALHER